MNRDASDSDGQAAAPQMTRAPSRARRATVALSKTYNE